MGFLTRLLITAIVAFALSYMLSGVIIDSLWQAIVLALLLGLLNAIVKPILIILTFPITIITFGLFLLIINALIILLADKILNGFQVKNFWWALLFGLLLSIITSVITPGKKE